MGSKTEHRSTSRVLDVLELISTHRNGYTLTEICESINAPKSSMSPILHTLLERGFLALDANSNKYQIGQMAFQVGNAYLDNFNIMNEIQNEMQTIVKICMETCHFAILVDGNVLYLKKIDSPESIRMISTIGKKIPAYGTALGKALLMNYDVLDLKKIYPNGLEPLTSNTITDFDELEKQLQKARLEGFTYEIEESDHHIRCVALPIKKDNNIVAALSVAIPIFRYSDDKAETIKHLLHSAKSKIEALLKNTELDFSYFI